MAILAYIYSTNGNNIKRCILKRLKVLDDTRENWYNIENKRLIILIFILRKE